MKHTKIILVGKAASGKDTLAKKLVERGYSKAVSHTTRPPRKGEENGKDYFFISKEEFEYQMDKRLFAECCQFNGWYYGLTKDQMVTNDVFILTPSGLRQIPEHLKKDCLIIFLDIPYDVRKQRLEERGDSADSLERRMKADEKDFEDFAEFGEYNIRITDSDQLNF